MHEKTLITAWIMAACAATAAITAIAPSGAAAQEAGTAVQEVSEADKEASKVLFQEAVALYKEGKHAQALAKFQESFKKRPHWRLHLNIGLCYMELGMYTEAKGEFTLFLGEGGTSVKPADQEQVQTELDKLATTIVVIDAQVLTEGAAVKLDGKKIGTAPLPGPIEANPGSHVLEVEKEGFEPQKQEFLLSKGEHTSYSFALVEKPKEPEKVPVVPVGPVLETPKKKSPVPFYVLLGATIALGGAAGAMGGLTLGQWGDLNDLDSKTEDAVAAGEMSTDDYNNVYLPARKDIQDKGELYGMLTTVFMAAAGAALVGTVVAGVITKPGKKEKKPEEGTPATTPSPAPAPDDKPNVTIGAAPAALPGGGMIVIGGTF